MVKIEGLGLGVVPLFQALGADSLDDPGQFLNNRVVVLEEFTLGDGDFHAFLHEVDGELLDGVDVLPHSGQYLLLLELASEEHGHTVLVDLVGHLQLAESLSKHLQHYLP